MYDANYVYGQGTNEILRLFIALSEMQHAGAELRQLVKYVDWFSFIRLVLL